MKSWITVAVIAAVFTLVVFPYADWGRVSLRTPETITVTGSSKTDVMNEVAQFYAGVTVTNDDKQAAITEVNQKMNETIEALKTFGIAEADIKTQNLSVYQSQDSVTLDGKQRTEPGQWNANNSIQVKLRDGSRTSDLVAVLTNSGLTDVSGPNFMTDDSTTDGNEAELLKKAVEAARAKATGLAEANGKRIVKVLSIVEGGSSNDSPIMFDRAMGGGGSPVQPGTSSQAASVTVTFEVR